MMWVLNQGQIEFLKGVLESITANILTGIFLYFIFRFNNPRSRLLTGFKNERFWFSAWVAYSDDPNAWVTELLSISVPLFSRSLTIRSHPIKSVTGIPIRRGEKSIPLYHWKASCVFTSDNAALKGDWHSILQPQKYKGDIFLDIRRLTLLVGDCRAASATGTKTWSGPIIICNDLEVMKDTLREFIKDESRISIMVNNLTTLQSSTDHLV